MDFSLEGVPQTAQNAVETGERLEVAPFKEDGRKIQEVGRIADIAFNMSGLGGKRLNNDKRWKFSLPPLYNAKFARVLKR